MMWSVPIPPFSVDNVFDVCVADVSNLGRRARLMNIRGAVLAMARGYQNLATATNLSQLVSHQNISDVTRQEMLDLYNRQFRDGAGRGYYRAIVEAPRHGICPLCCTRMATTLDHVMGKSPFPIFAITPVNLVPSCRDCNTAKGQAIPISRDDEFIHPYFDNFDNDLWLVAEVNSDQAIVRFRVEPPHQWQDPLPARVIEQFRRLELGDLYKLKAAEELCNIAVEMRNLLQAGGSNQVMIELQFRAQSRSAYKVNSWQSALYRALASSNWYCQGGMVEWT